MTMGDPAGVGPETIAKAWMRPRIHELCRPVVLGHPALLRRALDLVGSPTRVVCVDDVSRVTETSPAELVCLPCGADEVLRLAPGVVAAGAGEAAYQCITQASRLALDGSVAAIVTGPINKAALVAAGHHYPGHTELLAELCGVAEVAMMLYLAPSPAVGSGRGLGVAHVTLHVALREVFPLLSTARIVRTAHLAHTVMRAFLRAEGREVLPRVGVCALNPHAGEGGLFGDEEPRLIVPAVEQGRVAGLDLHGPYPADTLLSRAAAGEFDAVVAMYHDQGHIALKLLTMHRAVNITLGLPVIRTSVAHGTAFDRAWQGTAQCESLVAAIEAAARLVGCRDALQWSGTSADPSAGRPM
jgi:4-hydroxythreonine-4-phosphate dehydrogenase